MAIPSFDDCFRPVLELAAKEDITRRSAASAMGDLFRLTLEERERKIGNSADSVIRSRISWVMSYLTKGALIDKVAPRTYRTTEFGKKFLKDHPVSISVDDLRGIPGWIEPERGREARSANNELVCTAAGVPPIEAIYNGLEWRWATAGRALTRPSIWGAAATRA